MGRASSFKYLCYLHHYSSNQVIILKSKLGIINAKPSSLFQIMPLYLKVSIFLFTPSSVKTPPTAVRRLPPNDINTMSNVGNRLGDYHMSKQNPAVIDQLYSPRDHKNDLYKTASPLFNGLNHSNGSRSGRTQIQTFLRQTLNRRNSLPGSTGTSLVHLALQGRQRRYDSVPVSPVIVRLSGSGLSGSKGAELGKLDEEETAVNPCDKDVVVSALRQKRWALFLLWFYTCHYMYRFRNTHLLLIPQEKMAYFLR